MNPSPNPNQPANGDSIDLAALIAVEPLDSVKPHSAKPSDEQEGVPKLWYIDRMIVTCVVFILALEKSEAYWAKSPSHTYYDTPLPGMLLLMLGAVSLFHVCRKPTRHKAARLVIAIAVIVFAVQHTYRTIDLSMRRSQEAKALMETTRDQAYPPAALSPRENLNSPTSVRKANRAQTELDTTRPPVDVSYEEIGKGFDLEKALGEER